VDTILISPDPSTVSDDKKNAPTIDQHGAYGVVNILSTEIHMDPKLIKYLKK